MEQLRDNRTCAWREDGMTDSRDLSQMECDVTVRMTRQPKQRAGVLRPRACWCTCLYVVSLLSQLSTLLLKVYLWSNSFCVANFVRELLYREIFYLQTAAATLALHNLLCQRLLLCRNSCLVECAHDRIDPREPPDLSPTWQLSRVLLPRRNHGEREDRCSTVGFFASSWARCKETSSPARIACCSGPRTFITASRLRTLLVAAGEPPPCTGFLHRPPPWWVGVNFVDVLPPRSDCSGHFSDRGLGPRIACSHRGLPLWSISFRRPGHRVRAPAARSGGTAGV